MVERIKMTSTGYDFIKKEIENKIVDVPSDMDLKELRAWMLGYAKCQSDIIKLIDKLKEDR